MGKKKKKEVRDIGSGKENEIEMGEEMKGNEAKSLRRNSSIYAGRQSLKCTIRRNMLSKRSSEPMQIE